ncbi:MAG: phosphate propanoyltransferase [Oscillospiraceae bacterium]|nr:phosphate propanoyltransferase [Oscillospiraceae bacterium]
MNEREIKDIIACVLEKYASATGQTVVPSSDGSVFAEASARHVHLTIADVERLFGAGEKLNPVRDLSQPGQFLSDKRVKLVTRKGTIDNVAVLGPERPETQVELSMTDCRSLGLKAPVRMSGDLSGAADVCIFGDKGCIEATGSVIVAKAHIHMTPGDARAFGVSDGQHVKVRVESARPLTLDDVVIRVSEKFALAMHIDLDEANACLLDKTAKAYIVK